MKMDNIISRWQSRQVKSMLEALGDWCEEHNNSRTYPSDPEFTPIALEELSDWDLTDLFHYLRGDNE